MNLKGRIKRARYKANKKIIGERDLRKRLDVASKDEEGYSSSEPYARALGFKDNWELNMPHKSSESYVYQDRLYEAIHTLLEAGFDIILPEELANKDLNPKH